MRANGVSVPVRARQLPLGDAGGPPEGASPLRRGFASANVRRGFLCLITPLCSC